MSRPPRSMRLRRALRAAPPLLLILAAGCRTAGVETACRVEIETRQLVVSVDRGGSAAGSGDSAQRARVLIGAREICWITPQRMWIDTNSTVRAPDGEGGIREHSSSRRIIDFAADALWTSRGASFAQPVPLWVIEHQREAARRRSRIDFADLYLRWPAVRSLEDLETFAGLLPLSPAWRDSADGRRRLAVLSTEAGARWELLVAPGGRADADPWLTEALLVAMLGIDPDESRRLAADLEGFVVEFTARLLPLGGEQTVTASSILSLEHGSLPDGLLAAQERRIEEARRSAAELSDAQAILEALRKLQPSAPDAEVIELVLRLEPRLDEAMLPAVEDVCSEAGGFLLQVELLRMLLRFDRAAGQAAARRALESDRGAAAVASAEALIAESDELARGAVIYILEGRREYTDLSEESILSWAAAHLRILSGFSLAELAERLEPIWPPERLDGDDRSDAERLEEEALFWIRWWSDWTAGRLAGDE